MRILWILAALAYATTASAQQLTVRSGDHPSFSRLTIPLPASQAWEASQVDSNIVVKLPGYSGGFDVDSVFTRMGRGRIEALDSDQNSITLKVTCQCTSNAFISGSLLVIDVADQSVELPTKLIEKDIARRPPINRRVQVTVGSLPWIGGNSPFNETPTGMENLVAEGSAGSQKRAIGNRTTYLGEMQQTLFTEVANAASNGILKNSYEPLSAAPIINEKSNNGSSVTVPDMLKIANGSSSNIRITSSMDLPTTTLHTRVNSTVSGATCPDDALVDVGTWGGELDFSEQIGPVRNNLMDARDQLDISVAETLARMYIYFGFGAEAMDVLRLDPKLVESQPQLADIATILEHGYIGYHNSLSDYTDCASDVALWAILSFRNVPPSLQLETKAALRALNKLPIHLRSVVAPGLSDRLLQSGDRESASAALRTIERLPDALAPSAQLAQADLAVGSGSSADRLLQNIIDANNSASPEALVRLVQGKLEKDQALSDDTATLVEAYAQELRSTELGHQLLQTQVIALSQSEQFDKAFEALSRIELLISPVESLKLHQAVFEGLVQKAPDILFLSHMFEKDQSVIASLPTPTKIKLAARLMDLGFAAKVETLLADSSDTSRSKERQMLVARAALALQKPFQAQAALIGITGADAEMILAQAKEMSGAYEEAARLFETNNAETEAARAAWLSDQWRDLVSPNNPGHSAIAALMGNPTDTIESGVGPLALANQTLDDSESARKAIEDLLRGSFTQAP
tara:strand:- start:4268 stop:6514 length:2247 start_codon:yes stop_codon:yes gene_type:complete